MIDAREFAAPNDSLAPAQDAACNRFFAEYWEKKPILLPASSCPWLPVIHPDEVFPAVVACCEDFCRNGRQRVRFYVNGNAVDILAGKHWDTLPKHQDGSFEGYNRRMTEALAAQEYALIIADWHQFDRPLWERILTAVECLSQNIGVSQSRMDTQLFIGTYKTTPFGVHIDPTSAFHFPLVGAKTMRLWEGAFGSQHPMLNKARHYEAFLQDSIVLSATPSEIIYWPSNYWHTAESDGAFSVTWGLGYWMGNNERNVAARKMIEMLESIKFKPAAISPRGAICLARTLKPIHEIIEDMSSLVVSRELRRFITQYWLEHYSAYGFCKVPPLREDTAVDNNSVIRKKSVYRILASPIEGNQVCVASAGHSITLPLVSDVCVAIDRLNDGKCVTMQGIGGDPGNRVVVNQVLEFCIRTGSCVVDDASAFS